MTICANIIKELRKEEGITQNEISKVLDCTQTCYSNWETGYREISLDALIKLCKLYNISADYILGLVEQPRKLYEDKE